MNLYSIDDLKELYDHAGSVEFHFFLKGPLSQWAPSNILLAGRNFPSAEHYMMWEKAMLFHDFNSAHEILKAATPSKAKEIGRAVRDYHDPTWAKHRANAVYTGNLAKFMQNPTFGKTLLETGDKVLVEVNPRDTIWGIGLSEYDADKNDPRKWRGQNLLGFTLMRVRDAIRETQ